MDFSFSNSLIIVIYATQAAIGLILFFIFRHFSSLYKRSYLLTWSWSWLLFSGAMILFGVISFGFNREPLGFWPDQALSFFSLIFIYTHLVFFVAGIAELIREQNTRRGTLLWLVVTVALITTFIVAFTQSDTRGPLNHFLRVSLRTFIVSSAFITAGTVLRFIKRLAGGLGHRIMSWSMIFYGIEQGYYFANSFFSMQLFPHVFGIIDLLMIFGIGLGMIIWLLEDEREKLRKANHELDRFVYSTSHDLRAPIASMLGLVNLARLEVKDEKSLELIGMMEQRVKKLDSVIADFLTLSRSKKSDAKITSVELNQLVDEVVSDVKFAQDAPSIRLIYNREPNFSFQSDFGIMKTVLGNLFSNSVKYHNIQQPDPYIRVVYRMVNEKVQIDVEDNGQGIETENLDKIFDMFYRASASSDGTGLGLYIVRESLSKLKGSIFVKSFFGKGSTFTILLPQPH